jgi:hypothetical protein
MIFFVVVVITKVVANFIILLVFKLHDHMPNILGVMNLTNDLSCLVHALCKFEGFHYLTKLSMKSCLSDNMRVIMLSLRFPNYPRSLLLVL